MTRYIHSDYNQHVGPSTTKTLHTGAGKIHAIVATCNGSTQTSIYLYDNTAGSGNVLMILYIVNYFPLVVIYPPDRLPTFETGLTVVTNTGATCHIITEA